MSEDDVARRRAARAAWPLRVFKLGSEPTEDLSATTTVAERLAMMWPLALDAFALAGQPLPTYTRSDMPGRVIRGARK